MPSGNGAVVLRLYGGAQFGSYGSVATPCSPNSACRLPAAGSPVGPCVSLTEPRVGTNVGPLWFVRGGSSSPNQKTTFCTPAARAAKASSDLPVKHLLGSLDPLAQPVLEHGVLLPSPDMVRDSPPNHVGDGLLVDRRDGLEFGRLFGGQPDSHGFHLFHDDIMP